MFLLYSFQRVEQKVLINAFFFLDHKISKVSSLIEMTREGICNQSYNGKTGRNLKRS